MIAFLFFLFALGTGISVAWIALLIAERTGWHAPTMSGFRSLTGGDWIVVGFAGPNLLLRNAYEHWGRGEVTTPTIAVLLVAGMGWCACIGVVVLQSIFAAGYILS